MFGQLMRRDGEQSGMIVVSGETRVGKTRLLDEFAIQASARGAITLCGGRGAHAEQFACGAFAVALEDYAANRSEAERTELARAYPALARFVPSLGAGIPLPAPAPDLRDYYRDLFPSIVQFFMDLARTKPVLLLLGDLHEADAVGLDLIKYLAHLAVGTPLLMVGALRDPDIDDGGPHVVAGDFNATRDHRPFRELLAAGFADCADVSQNRSWPGFAWPAEGRALPVMRLDHVLVSRTATVPMTRTIRVPRTDHHGVLAAIEFTQET